MKHGSLYSDTKSTGSVKVKDKKVDLFIYLYADTGVYYVFNDLKTLCKTVEKMDLPLMFVKNKVPIFQTKSEFLS